VPSGFETILHPYASARVIKRGFIEESAATESKTQMLVNYPTKTISAYNFKKMQVIQKEPLIYCFRKLLTDRQSSDYATLKCLI
jgi:hypothetical protein